jgi:anti-sigma factor RsiW
MTWREPRNQRHARCDWLSGEELERHLFLCADCRGRVRLATAWDALKEDGPADTGASSPDERFVAHVREAIRTDGLRRHRTRLLLAAAAVLLFFFAAGISSKGRLAATSGNEEIEANLATPAALEGLLPD